MATATPHRDSVTRDIEMRILLDDGNSVPMPCTMTYTIADPFAVSVTFHSTEGNVTWVFSRELLVEGMDRQVGDGDIKVRPIHAVGRSLLRIELNSPAGEAVMEGPMQPVRDFVSSSLDLLPIGLEWQYLNFDSGLARLLNDEVA